MKNYSTEELFELVATVPTELSREQVSGIIKTLPTISPGNTWFKNLNLNSIIMTTTAITIVGSALLYFLNTTTTPELPGQEISAPEIIMTDSIKTAVSEEPEETPQVLTVTPEDVATTDVDPVELQTDSKPVEAQSKPALEEKSEPSNLTATVSETDPTPIASKKESIQPEAKDEIGKISPGGLRKLKREFLRLIAQDKLTKDKDDRNVLSFTTDALMINDKEVAPVLYKKYADLMASYNIMPGENQKLVTHKDYIMVGNFGNDGFDGQALGKNMDIKFSGNSSAGSDLFGKPLDTITSIPSPSILSPDLTTIPKESIINQTRGNGSESQGKLEQGQKLIDSNSSNSQLLDTGKESVNILNTKSNRKPTPNPSTNLISPSNPNSSKPALMNTREVKKLKRALYSQLNDDDIISTNRDNVRMLIRPQEIEVNGQKLNENQFSKYVGILDKHRVQRGLDRKILMSVDFIFVGKFNGEQFDGTMQGKMNSETVIGTILEEDLMSLSIFNNEVISANGLLTIGKFDHVDGEETPIDSDKVQTESRSVPNFKKIRTSGVAVVYLTYGAQDDIEVKVWGMPIKDVTTKVVNGLLKIDTKGTPQGERIEVYVTSDQLNDIHIDGASELRTENTIKADELVITSGDVGAAWMDIDTKSLTVELSGGDLELSGNTEYMDINYGRNAQRGTFHYDQLEVESKRYSFADNKIAREKFQTLRDDVISYLGSDGYIKSEDERITLTFTNKSLTANGKRIKESSLSYYQKMLDKYGIKLRHNRKLYIIGKRVILADLNDNGFKFEADGGGEEMKLNNPDSWKKLEDYIFENN